VEILDPTMAELEPFLEPQDKRRIVPAFMYQDQVIEYFHGDGKNKGQVLPWSNTHHHIHLRPNEVSVWAGVNGHGKSLVLNQVMLAVMAQGAKSCIASFEMTPMQTMQRMTRQAVGANVPTVEAIKHFHDEWTDGRLWVYDQMNSVNPHTLLAVIRYCRYAIGMDHFVIDSLMKCGIGADDYNKQKWFINELCVIAKDTGMHIHLVAHSRKKETEKTVMDKFDIKGTSEITDMVDNVFTVWRNKKKEDAKRDPEPDMKLLSMPDAIVNCDKQRHGEWEGKIPLWLQPESMQFMGREHGRAVTIYELESHLMAQDSTGVARSG